MRSPLLATADSGFVVAPAEHLVATGATGPRSARLWVRVSQAGPLVLRARVEDRPDERLERAVDGLPAPEADGTFSFEVDGLAPGTRYRYELSRAADGALLGAGRLETAPEGPARDELAIGLASCNLPFEEDGTVSPRARSMLRGAERVLRDERASLMLWMGDQMYTDLPASRSLLASGFFRSVAPPGRERLQDCSAEEVRRILQARYRAFWSVEGARELHALLPGYPIWDDHELVDNWGSDPAHSTAEWRAFGVGARRAFCDYQASRVFSREELAREEFDYTIDHGDVAVRVLDLRSNRLGGPDGRILSPSQLEGLRAFLAARSDRSVLLIVLSVPLAHLPRPLASFAARALHYQEDFSDRWAAPGDREDRDAMLRLLFDHARAHPAQKLVLLSGDIHIGCAHVLRPRGGGPPIHQLVASGLTHTESRPVRRASALAMTLNRSIALAGDARIDVRRLPTARGRNPYLDLHLGLLHLHRRPDGTRALRFRLYGERHGEPTLAYESPWF